MLDVRLSCTLLGEGANYQRHCPTSVAIASAESPNNQRKYGVWGYNENDQGQITATNNGMKTPFINYQDQQNGKCKSNELQTLNL